MIRKHIQLKLTRFFLQNNKTIVETTFRYQDGDLWGSCPRSAPLKDLKSLGLEASRSTNLHGRAILWFCCNELSVRFTDNL